MRLLRALTGAAPAAGAAQAQQKLLTLDDIYDPGRRVNFSGDAGARRSPGSTASLRCRPRGDRGGVDWMKVDAATGVETPLFDAAKMEAALAAARRRAD